MFTVGRRHYADPFHGLEETVPEYTMRLHQALPHPKATISYTYDLGASWRHEILLEKVLDEHPLPALECVAGKGGNPIEYYDPDDPRGSGALRRRSHQHAAAHAGHGEVPTRPRVDVHGFASARLDCPARMSTDE